MNVVNLMPHTIRVMVGEDVQEFPASGIVARCQTIETVEKAVDGLPVVSQQFGEIEGLPEPQPETIYLVSKVIGNALAASRNDIYGPNTSPNSVIRNANGQITAVRSLVKYG